MEEEPMAKPYARRALVSSLALLAALALGACTWGSDDRYAQGELVCADAKSCDAMWSAATDWISKNSALALAERSDRLLETRCGSAAEAFACYTVMRQPQRTGETHIHIYIACGNDFIGCAQPATRLRNQLADAMVSASPEPSAFSSYAR
jgi:hypothetical protein